VREIKEVRSGLPYPFFTIIPDTLALSEKEKNDVVAFLKSLTDSTAMKNFPKRLPELTGKYAALNKRKIGGEY
jgi:cytochrome c peroxidase